MAVPGPRVLSALLVVALGACDGCRPSPTNPDPTAGQAAARVVLPQAGTNLVQPVEGALVRVRRSTITTRTGADGRFNIAIPVGHGGLIITHEQGGTQYSTSVDATARGWAPGSSTNLGDIPLQLNGAVRGTVQVEDNTDHAQIQVVVVGEPLSALTSGNGQYALDQLTPGNNAFAAVKVGYRIAEFSGQVAPGQVIELRQQTLNRLTGMERVGTLVGRALLLGQTDHSGIHLEATGLNGALVTADTPADGTLRVANITSALINVSFSKAGYTTLRIPYLIIPEGGTLDMGDVVLGTGEALPPPVIQGSSSSGGSSSGPTSSSTAASSGPTTSSSNAPSSSPASSASGPPSSTSSTMASSLAPSSALGTSSGGGSSGSSTGASFQASSMTVLSSSSSAAPSSSGPPAHCSNTVPDPQETGTDCGGPCPPCAAGVGCNSGMDCESGVCSLAGTCATPDCMDNVTNGDETDEDCGGPLCLPCAQGQRCLEDRDCSMTRCLGGRCRTTRLLTVHMPDAGQPVGAVESSPPGIACGPRCTAAFEEGASVTLSAVTTPSQTLAGWGGDCVGDGGCVLTLDMDRTVSAGFDGTAPLLPLWRGGIDQGVYLSRTVAAWTATGAVVAATGFRSATNPGLGSITPAGGMDVAVVRTDAFGTVTAQRRMGGPGDDYPVALVPLPNDDVLVVGRGAAGTYEFGDPGQPVTCPVGGGVLMARLTASLGHVWSRCLPLFTVNGAVLDGANILSFGSYSGMVDFGDGPRTAQAQDMILLRHAVADGAFVQAGNWGGAGADALEAVARADDGSLALAGTCEGTLAWGTGMITTRNGDICVARLTSGLTPVWGGFWGGVGLDTALAVAWLGTGDLVTAGTFRVDTTFELPPAPPAQSLGRDDAFLMRVDGNNGALQWVRTFGTTGDDLLTRLAVLGGDVVIVGGYFDGGPINLGGVPLVSADTDGLLGAFTAQGTHVWSGRGVCANQGDGVHSMDVQPDGRILVGLYCQFAAWGLPAGTRNGPSFLVLR